jgi:hypothetical protein
MSYNVKRFAPFFCTVIHIHRGESDTRRLLSSCIVPILSNHCSASNAEFTAPKNRQFVLRDEPSDSRNHLPDPRNKSLDPRNQPSEPRNKPLDLRNQALDSGNEPSDLRNQHTDSRNEGGER